MIYARVVFGTFVRMSSVGNDIGGLESGCGSC
jgi:hypothetical protein